MHPRQHVYYKEKAAHLCIGRMLQHLHIKAFAEKMREGNKLNMFNLTAQSGANKISICIFYYPFALINTTLKCFIL